MKRKQKKSAVATQNSRPYKRAEAQKENVFQS